MDGDRAFADGGASDSEAESDVTSNALLGRSLFRNACTPSASEITSLEGRTREASRWVLAMSVRGSHHAAA